MKSYSSLLCLANVSAQRVIGKVGRFTTTAHPTANTILLEEYGMTVLVQNNNPGTQGVSPVYGEPSGSNFHPGLAAMIVNSPTSSGSINIWGLDIPPGYSAEVFTLRPEFSAGPTLSIQVFGPGSGGGRKYIVSDFTAAAEDWTIGTTHALRAVCQASDFLNGVGATGPSVQVFEAVGGNYVEVLANISATPSGDVTLTVPPGLTFGGRTIAYIG
jgi:hypothetical protein